ncbi:hypothetical protein C0993_006438, partial [Termitomyces sp. T159_Od127]
KVKLTDATPAAALTWLCCQKENWLMIFDNADDPDINLLEYLPNCNHGNILITSRNSASNIYAPQNHYKVDKMTLEDSLAVFYKASQRSTDEEEAAKELVKELGFLAFAIVQVGIYLLHNEDIGVKQYLESYKKDRSRYVANIVDNYQLSVFATWDLNYQKLDEKAKAILMLCGVLHNSKIPMSILKKAWNNLSNACEIDTQELQDFLGKFVTSDKNWSDELLEEAVCMLRSYSLVELSRTGVMFLEIHSLVHQWAFESLSRKEQKKAKQCAQQLFYCLGVKELEYNDAIGLVIHLQALMNFLSHECENYKVAKQLGRIFFTAYFWSDAEILQWQVFRECEQVLGSDHSVTILAMVDLAMTLKQGGKLEEAEKLEKEVLKLRTEAVGISHSDTIGAMSNLAQTLHLHGKLIEAEKLEQKVLENRTKAFGTKHLETMEAMSKLAATFWKGGKLEEAEKLEKEVFKFRTQTFGTNHPDTIQAMSNLGAIFWKAGKLQEAEKLEQKVLKVRREALGTTHPDTTDAMYNLAATLRKSQKLEEAEELGQEVLKIRTEAFGTKHPETTEAMSSLAETFWRGRKLEEAQELQKVVFNVRTEAFGTNHPDTIQAMSNLAAIFWKGGKLKEAEILGQEVLKLRIEAFGTSHPDTIQAMSNLAAILGKSGKLEEAEKLGQEVLKVRLEALGISHTDTLEAISNLAAILWQGGKLEEVEKLEQEVLKVKMEPAILI